MLPKRISIKFFVENPEAADDLGVFIPIFQRWIQQDAMEGVLIDAVNYQHVHWGPGVILIGHEGDYSYNVAEGRPGVLYTQKVHLHDTLRDVLSAITRRALMAAERLAAEPALSGLRIDTQEAQITFLDRLRFPNTAETFDAIRDTLTEFAASLYDTQAIGLDLAASDPRAPFTIRVQAGKDVALTTLAARLHESVAQASSEA